MNFFLKDWLRFSKKESLGIIALLVAVLFFLLLPEFYSPTIDSPAIDSALIHYLHEKPPSTNDSVSIVANNETRIAAINMFYFDPNTLDKNGWEKLGINKKTIGTIMNYRNKGGRFREPKDLRKIWGLMPYDAERIIPFVSIPNSNLAQFDRKPYAQIKQKVIDINNATLADWESLPGIGPVLANRILKFKEKTGGFVSIDQVAKTYGITDSVFNSIKPYLSIQLNEAQSFSTGSDDPNKSFNKKDTILNVNTASVAQLMQSGIEEGLAKAIVLYRKQYGKFTQLADLKQIILINEAVYQQIMPKLKVE